MERYDSLMKRQQSRLLEISTRARAGEGRARDLCSKCFCLSRVLFALAHMEGALAYFAGKLSASQRCFLAPVQMEGALASSGPIASDTQICLSRPRM
ncbi:hypothetical protein JCGZ_11287 [Jatropha curcas]|uniref:Uncharacterized protein n=1 Tax=Jatropha curcas TaxID=180498 RepID=A0A067KEW3_JATCU|nr:hypothetical protein JCGZ_11287 [Jatropha curcas]